MGIGHWGGNDSVTCLELLEHVVVRMVGQSLES